MSNYFANLFSGLNGSSTTTYSPQPAAFNAPTFNAPTAPQYSDPYTAQLLGYVNQMGQGQSQQINQSYDRNAGTLTGNLFARGLGSSSLVDNYAQQNQNDRSQALTSLAGQLAGEKLQAAQSGAGLALQRYGADNQQYGAQLNSATNLYDSQLNSATQRYGIDSQARTSSSQLAASLFRNSAGGPNYVGGQSQYPQMLGGNLASGGSAAYPGSYRY